MNIFKYINNYYMEKITNILIGFHTASHISFALTNNYPIFYNTFLYKIFSSTDPLTHLLLYHYKNNYIHLLWFFWHIVKSIDKTKKLRSIMLINNLEAVFFINTFIKLFPHSFTGILLYIPLRYLNFTW